MRAYEGNAVRLGPAVPYLHGEEAREVEVSEPCLKDLKPMTKFEVVKGPYEVRFDKDGNLPPI